MPLETPDLPSMPLGGQLPQAPALQTTVLRNPEIVCCGVKQFAWSCRYCGPSSTDGIFYGERW